jgi:hypothetical protein
MLVCIFVFEKTTFLDVGWALAQPKRWLKAPVYVESVISS